MNQTPHVDDAIEKTKIDKAEASTHTGVDTIPDTIREMLRDPPLLPHESEDRFLELFESFRNYAEPENIIDYHLVHTATVNKWETVRYRFMATAVTANQQHAGLKSLFIQTHDDALIPIAEQSVARDAAKNAKRCLTDSDYREEAYLDFESMGYIPDGQAFLLSLPDLAIIERLAASAEKRYAAAIKEIERRRADRAAKRRMTLGESISTGEDR
jgi:hypothetical protein